MAAGDEWTDDELVNHLLQTGRPLRGKKRTAKAIAEEEQQNKARMRADVISLIGKVAFFGGIPALIWFFGRK